MDAKFNKGKMIETNNNPARITLIRPPVLELRSNLSSYGAVLPIGLGYIAAVLRDAGHHLTVIDAPGEAIEQYVEIPSPIGALHSNGLTVDEIVDRIPWNTEIIGMTNMYLHEWPTLCEIAEKAAANVPEAVIVIGGENATAFRKRMFDESPHVDYCVLGEGEAAMLELVHCIKKGLPADHIQGIASRTRKIDESNPREYLSRRETEIDSIPTPAWEFFKVEDYLGSADHHGVHRGRSIPMTATRGCPFRCTFCSSPAMWTTRYVTRDPQDVVDEMRLYVKKYGIDNVNFCDLAAIIKRDWILEFTAKLKKEKWNVNWQLPTGTRSETLDEEVLRGVYETGCRNITYAPESGSERMLDLIKKKINMPQMLDSLRAARRQGLVTRVNIIIGHPKEKRSDTWKSLRLLIRCAFAGCDDAAVMIFAPYPGSADTDELVQAGKVEIAGDYYYLALARSGWSSRTYNPFMGTTELIIVQFFMLSVFYAFAYILHPSRIFDVFKSIFTGNEKTQLDQLIRTKMARKIGLEKYFSRKKKKREEPVLK